MHQILATSFLFSLPITVTQDNQFLESGQKWSPAVDTDHMLSRERNIQFVWQIEDINHKSDQSQVAKFSQMCGMCGHQVYDFHDEDGIVHVQQDPEETYDLLKYLKNQTVNSLNESFFEKNRFTNSDAHKVHVWDLWKKTILCQYTSFFGCLGWLPLRHQGDVVVWH